MDELKGLKIGFAICGSFCNYDKTLIQINKLTEEGAEIVPIMSLNAQSEDTRFGKAEDFIQKVEQITNKKILKTGVDVEPIGPQNTVDCLFVYPCTGNTMAKLANGIADTPVLGAIKTLLRNNKPIILGVSSNDLLGINMQNIGKLMYMKNIYFVPLGQDNYEQKPNSLAAKTEFIIPTIKEALKGKQLEPVIVSY